MSMEYCHECDKMIDLDYTEHWEHFSEEMKGGKENGNKRKK